MADNAVSCLSPPNSEELRNAAGHFEYANRAAVGGNYDIAIQLLRTSCKLVPTNLSYRQALRKAAKTRYKDNRRGSFFAPLTTLPLRYRLWRAMQKENYRKALEHGEAILARNPWHKGAQLHMAKAASALDLPVLAVWILQQARESDAKDPDVNPALARLLESQGHFSQAIVLWEMVRRAVPHDKEAQDKSKQLAATDTIARGNYQDVAQHGEQVVVSGDTKQTTPPPATKKLPPVKARAAKEEETLRACVEADPSNPDHYLRLAAVHRRNGQIDDAHTVLTAGKRATGEALEVVLALADLEIEPLRRNLAKTEEQVRAKPHDEKLQKARADLMREINASELDCYRRRTENDPSDKNNRFEFGLRLLQAGKVEEAICEFQTARSDARLQWKALMNLGHCFAARQNWPLARRNYDEALRNIPDGEESQRKELLFLLARGHADAGELPRAIELALDLADLDYAYRNIGRLLEEWQGRVQPASTVEKTTRK